MKKIISVILAAALFCSICFAFAELDDDLLFDTEESEILLDESSLVSYDYDDITIGNPTSLNGQFFTDLWGNSTSDTDVRHLVSGYNLVIWGQDTNMFRFDKSVVSAAVVSDDKDGNRTYLLALYSDLFYSDGTPITSRDYAFSVLLQCSPVVSRLGGHSAVLDYLVGYEDYISGNTPYISGLRVLADNLISFTVKSEALPYFYELSRLAFYPYPIKAIAPGCAIYDDGNGAYIAAAEKDGENPFSAELLNETILDPGHGYQTFPDPVSGSYRLTSYSGESATFEINTYYKGNEAGKKPRIKRITYTLANNETMISELGEGKFVLLNKVAYAPALADGLRLCAESEQYTRTSYPRVGLTYLYLNPNCTPLQDLSVRQALALCFDKQEFVSEYVGAFGIPVDGLYGFGQWMTEAVSGSLLYPFTVSEDAGTEELARLEAEAEAWDELSLDSIVRYELDTEKASLLLEEAGWTLNENGQPFDPETDSVRYKLIDGELLPLDLKLGYPSYANVQQALSDYLIDNLATIGVRVRAVPIGIETIVALHRDHTISDYDIIFLGDNFNISFDPALFFRNDEVSENLSGSETLVEVYRELFELSEDMDHTEPRDLLGYMQKWISFQQRLTETLPLIPVYSNVYFDFYTRELDDYWIEENVSWSDAIVAARMRSIKTNSDIEDIISELSYADGDTELDISSLAGSHTHEATDYSNGDLSRFPEYVREQVPSDYRTIYEIVAAKLNEEAEDATDKTEMEFYFQTPYPENETVYLLFGIPRKGSDVDWYVRKGTGLANGNIKTELDKELYEKLEGITFALAVVSK